MESDRLLMIMQLISSSTGGREIFRENAFDTYVLKNHRGLHLTHLLYLDAGERMKITGPKFIDLGGFFFLTLPRGCNWPTSAIFRN